ncbi:alkaline phosphatase-like protein [Hesseltinella vesiculosa]|uniref:alkaline phosphatase n=1 Tax=Hesseltinella vesiculosa TaxID=101127 RepID=A0A1X2GW53_9FUNG|nr:alkaline phosphatase-like protein [Hesseltinella vesiculosa]
MVQLKTFVCLAQLAALALAVKPNDYQRVPDQEGQYPRLGACPDKHACIFPPTESQFLAGGYFDLRVELHAYDEDTTKPVPSPFTTFKTTVRKNHGSWKDASQYFHASVPPLEQWHFNWTQSIETKYAKQLALDAKPVDVAVTSRVWRKLQFKQPGVYDVKVEYGPKSSYVARYTVVQPTAPKQKAKNVILFISDGTNTGAITAARALARQHTSGKYHDLLSFESFDELGHVITNSVDSLLTDSANSATAYASGHKSSPSALNVYADSSADPLDDPKIETITELIRRRQPGKAIGIVSTAYIQDATPAAFYSHTRQRSVSGEITRQFLHGVPHWTDPVVPDVFLGGGAEYFSGNKSLNGTDFYKEVTKAGYASVFNKKDLTKYNGKDKLFGVFRQGNMDVWFERNLYVNNTVGNKANPDNQGKNDALGSDQPGLQDMTLKALEVLKKRGGNKGFFLMSEAASVDKQMHTFDYSRALADLIELDVTIKKTVEWLKENGEYEDTLIIVTADHSHSFDVYGSVDAQFMRSAKEGDRLGAIGVYENAGFPGYVDEDGDGFPDNWHPEVTLAFGTNNGPAHYEAWQVSANAPRYPSVTDDHGVIVPNPKDMAGNFGHGVLVNNNLPFGNTQGVHSMSDVFLYSHGPGSELFKKTFENWQVFFKMAQALGLGESNQ